MRKLFVLVAFVITATSSYAAITYNATIGCGGTCVTMSLSWADLPLPVYTAEVDDNLGNTLFALNVPSPGVTTGSIVPNPQTAFGIPAATLQIITNGQPLGGTPDGQSPYAVVVVSDRNGFAIQSVRFVATVSACPNAPNSLSALNIERTLNLGPASTGGALFSTLTPSLNPTLLQSLMSGALEAREQISLNTATNVLTIQGFTTQPGSASPTPARNIFSSSVVYSYQVQVDKISFSCQPVASLLITGTLVDNFPNTPFGNANGALVAVGLGYSSDVPPKLNNVTVLLAGLAGLYSASAAGTLTFPSATVNPPGTSSVNPVIVFTPGSTQTTLAKEIQLDASKSTDPNNLQLTYSWTQVNTNIPASIANSNTATPLVTFAGGTGDYTFQVVVTDSKGNRSSAQTTITYFGR